MEDPHFIAKAYENWAGPGASSPFLSYVRRARAPRGRVGVVSTVTFLAYGMALPQFSIWYRRSWATTMKALLDSLIYGLVTGAVFAWLWPK